MKNKKINQDIYISFVLLLFGVFFLVQSFQLRKGTALFPMIILIIFILLSILLIISGFKNKNEGTKRISFSEMKIPFMVFGIITAYIIAMSFLGFIISTCIFIPTLMLFYYYNKKLLYPLCTIGTIGFIYVLFNIILKLQLP